MGDGADDAFDRALRQKIAQEENWEYILTLTDEHLVSSIRWYLDPVVEEEFGELEFKPLVKGICEYWGKHHKLSDAQRLSLRIGLSKIDQEDPYGY